MSKITGKTALITGAASGIGRLMGEMLLQKGLRTLIALDVNEKLLHEVSSELTKKGFHIIPIVVDLVDYDAIIVAIRRVLNDVRNIDILINNAGIVVGKAFIEHTHHDIDRTLTINTGALMHITKEILPTMISNKNGHILNIASAAGMLGIPNMSVYAASKWAVIGWSESLRLEMKKSNPCIKITTVTPFYISTGMFDGVKSKLIPIVEPKIAAKKILTGIENDKRFVRMPGIVYALPFIKGILPAAWFDVIVGKWMGIYKTMDKFRGRK